VKLIAENLAQCGVSDRYAIIRTRLSHAGTLAGSTRIAPASIDIAVLDPPYDEPDLDAAIALVDRWLAPGGILVLEHARRREPPERAGGLIRTRELTSGDSALAFFTAWEKTA
jgi:16S rRNA G966 N2-methylase RsmD